jgi:hypothetical protein
MKKIFYEKKGRRYVPVAEYDSDYMDSFPKGNHLVMCYPGGASRRFHIDPNYAAMIAAGRVAEDKICSALVKASELKPQRVPLTPGQIEAWNRLKKEFGDDMYGLRGVSVRDCVEEGMNSMMEEANKLMTNPVVKKAFENFILVCELTKEKENDHN